MARTAVTSVALAAAFGLSCGGTSEPAPSVPRVDFVDGAIEPILHAGQSVVIEGFGFGDAPGTVSFPRAGGGQVGAAVADSTWSDQTIRITVPDSAASGAITVLSAEGRRLPAAVRVLPVAAFDPATLVWTARPVPSPRAPVGVALAAATAPAGSGVTITAFAAGGAEPLGIDSAFLPDSGVYASAVQPGGLVSAWVRQQDLPVPRAFAAAAVANRYNSRFAGSALYVLGGIGPGGRAQSGVYGAAVNGGTVVRPFEALQPLPAPVAGAIAVVRRGRIYVFGGADSLGRPQRGVYVGRIAVDGQIDGWYTEPALAVARAYGGGVVLDDRAVVFGGLQDSAPPGGGLDSLPARLATADTAAVSLLSGFLTGGWAPAAPALPDGRSQFATLDLGDQLLLVGGRYPGDTAGTAETLAATIRGDTLATFTAVSGVTAISANGGPILVGPAGIAWRDADGTAHGLVLGGFNLRTRLRTAGVWGF
ncbi:MAG: hypothetical protein AUI55_01760 [Gemmatimonadetes bacterium 13_1_40CM_2_70_7]|nr:MAG: hypothetical protein AUI55_01760 [Gemmatimonadetes bacterium 13_1_40CM_2_70_7]